MAVFIKRIYEPATADDGFRVLVDRLWPRGVSRQRAKLDLWLKDIAPSTELRQWFGHEPAKFKEFAARYHSELAANPAVKQLQLVLSEHKKVTLLYGAKDPTVNHAAVLKKFLKS